MFNIFSKTDLGSVLPVLRGVLVAHAGAALVFITVYIKPLMRKRTKPPYISHIPFEVKLKAIMIKHAPTAIIRAGRPAQRARLLRRTQIIHKRSASALSLYLAP